MLSCYHLPAPLQASSALSPAGQYRSMHACTVALPRGIWTIYIPCLVNPETVPGDGTLAVPDLYNAKGAHVGR